MMRKIGLVLFASLALMLTACTSTEESTDDSTLNIYASRHYDIDKELIEEFEEANDVTINITELDSDELIARLKTEGDNTQADLVFMNGAENIAPVLDTETVKELSVDVPSSVDSKYYGDNWVGITKRARVIASTKNNADNSITSYSDIAEEDFNKTILVRSSGNEYNQALIASMIQTYGEDYAQDFVDGVVSNFARTPEGNDRDQAKALVAGAGDVAILNSYYMHLLFNSTDESESAVGQELAAYNIDDIHENISFIAPLSENSLINDFTEFLLSKEVQERYADVNGEYPVNSDATVSEYISTLPEFTTQDINFEELGNYIEQAYEMMLTSGWE